MQTRTVQVKQVSDLAGEREIHEFFSFSGEIEHIEIQRREGVAKITKKSWRIRAIKDSICDIRRPECLEIAFVIGLYFLDGGATLVDQIVSITPAENFVPKHEMQEEKAIPTNGRIYISRAQDVVTSVLAKVGISVVNEKVKSVDQRLHVSDKTMAAIFAAERKLNDTGSAVKTSRYVTAGSAWLNGAFSRWQRFGQEPPVAA
ncbi:hypothetical protein SESBI_50514 [Sesbania bispinosa]|nr:hypothetical protein SESBI_50514 [Sesbania bispinosa]